MLHQIGAGALGPVFRAYEPEPGRLVAVKLFRLDLPPEKAHQLVAELEKLVAVELSHPGIAAPIGAGLTGISAYLAQDFVAADSLDVVVRAGTSTPGAVARVAAQLGSALDYAADCDVFHGALHPRDVLMSDDDVRMTGVGVARALAHVGISAPVRRPYSAPERAVGGPWDGRADLFSLAALTFELLYGRRVSGTGERAVASLPEIPGASRVALKRLFAKALSGDPAGRFSSGTAFADALQGALTHTAPTAVPLVFEPEPVSRQELNESRLAEAVETAAMPLNEPVAVSELPLSAATTTPETLEALPLTESELRSEPAEAPLLAVESPDFDVSRVFEGEHAGTIEPTPSTPDLQLHSGDLPLDASIVPSHLRLALDAAEERTEDTPHHVPAPLAAMAPESSRSAVWPLVLALVVGIAIGFGMAMVFIGRGQPLQSAQQVASPRAAPSVVVEEPIVPATDTLRSAAPASAAGQSGTAAPVAPTPTPPSAVNEPVATRPAQSAPSAAAGPAPVRTRPRPEPPARRMLVRSTPSGAQVLLDGKSAGVTPLTVRDVGLGVHAVRITRDGYVAAERRVSITDARPAASITVQLVRARPAARPAPAPAPAASATRPAAKFGALVVDSRPSGATVYIDGRLMGRTPLLLDEVDAREHTIGLEMAGYKRWASSIAVVGGARTRVAASLEQ